MWESQIITLDRGTVLVQCGPMRMFIQGAVGGIPQPELCRRAAREAVGFLEQIAARRHLLERPAVASQAPSHPLARTMHQAALQVGDPDLTPMAAVAGTIADATADFLEQRGMTRVVVDNGGDLALRLKNREAVVVGIRSRVQEQRPAYRVRITPEMGIGGIATSGLGGRSFTRGVASAATTLSSRAAMADAAATALANATLVDSPAVRRCRAETIYPDTDLKGMEVTREVGRLSEEEVQTALSRGSRKAEQLQAQGLIRGCCLVVQGRLLVTGMLCGRLETLPGAREAPS